MQKENIYLPLVLLQDLGLCALLEAVEGDVEGLRVTVDNAKLVANRLKKHLKMCKNEILILPPS